MKKQLNEVKKQIKAHPEEFSMNHWAHKGACGSVACIAGWLVLLNNSGERVLYGMKRDGVVVDVREEAAQILGINTNKKKQNEKLEKLFHTNGWPQELQVKFDRTFDTEEETYQNRAAVACEAIDWWVSEVANR
jgi:hypothetical protein